MSVKPGSRETAHRPNCIPSICNDAPPRVARSIGAHRRFDHQRSKSSGLGKAYSYAQLMGRTGNLVGLLHVPETSRQLHIWCRAPGIQRLDVRLRLARRRARPRPARQHALAQEGLHGRD